MIDDVVKVIVSVLIANDKTAEHPYLTSFIKGFLIALLAVGFIFIKDLISGEITFESIKRGVIVFILGGGILSVVFCLIEFIFKSK
jgi:hypothetical protein